MARSATELLFESCGHDFTDRALQSRIACSTSADTFSPAPSRYTLRNGRPYEFENAFTSLINPGLLLVQENQLVPRAQLSEDRGVPVVAIIRFAIRPERVIAPMPWIVLVVTTMSVRVKVFMICLKTDRTAFWPARWKIWYILAHLVQIRHLPFTRMPEHAMPQPVVATSLTRHSSAPDAGHSELLSRSFHRRSEPYFPQTVLPLHWKFDPILHSYLAGVIEVRLDARVLVDLSRTQQ